jgi:hypothetical protein
MVEACFKLRRRAAEIKGVIPKRGLVALLACAALAGAFAAPASAETVPPQLTSLDLSPTLVNTSGGDATVNIQINASDAGSGVHHVIASLTEPGGVSFDTSFFGQPSSGNANNGTWDIVVNMPRFSPQGNYELTVQIVDNDGNVLSLSQADLQTLFGVSYVVNQEAAGDLLPPGLEGVSISPAAVDTSTSSGDVLVTVDGSDDLSGVEQIAAKLTGPGPTEVVNGASGAPDSGTPTNGSWSIPMSIPQGSPDGTYTLSLELADRVGRVTTLTSGDINALGFPNSVANNDLTPPLVAIQSGPNGPTNAVAPTFSWTTEPGATVQCSVDQGTPSFGACSGGATHTAAGPLPDGDYTFRVKATDAATNTATATRSFSVDTVAPDTQIDSGPDGLIPTAAADFGFSSGDAGASFECRLDGGSFAACGSPKSYAGIADGDHAFDVRAVDVAGNPDPSPATRAFSVNAKPPVVTITSGPEGPTSEARPTFGFDADPGTTVECSFDHGDASFGPCSGPASASPDADLAEGNWTFRVRATDAGGRSATATRSFTVDLQLPETIIVSGPAEKTFKNRAKFKFEGDGASSFECKFDKRHKRHWFPCSSPTKYKHLAKGKHKFKVRGIDAAGNIDTTPAKSKFKVVRLSL